MDFPLNQNIFPDEYRNSPALDVEDTSTRSAWGRNSGVLHWVWFEINQWANYYR